MMGYHNEPYTKGVMCQLVHSNTVTVIDYDDETYKPEWCPLKPLEVVDDN